MKVWGDSTCSLGRTGRPVVELRSPVRFWFDSTCSKPRTTGQNLESREGQIPQRAESKLELFGLGCQFSQHWPRGDEIVVDERFVGPSLVAGDLMEEIGELAGAIADAA